MKTLYLIACSQAKTPTGRYSQAGFLYSGDLFKKSRAYAEALSAPWGILSAKYGVLHPADLIETYNLVLSNRRIADIEYGVVLLGSFKILLDRYEIDPREPFKLVLLAGLRYRFALSRYVFPLYPRMVVEAPLASLGIGYQKQKLAQLTREIAR